MLHLNRRLTQTVTASHVSPAVSQTSAPRISRTKDAPFAALRQVSINYNPTDFASRDTGHIAFALSDQEKADLRQLHGIQADHPIGLQGRMVDGPSDILREKEMVSRDGHRFANRLVKAAHPTAPYPDKLANAVHIGQLRPDQIDLVARLVRNAPKFYSLAGSTASAVDQKDWTLQDISKAIGFGEVPTWGSNCVDFVRDFLVGLAGTFSPEPGELAAFKKLASKETRPQGLAALAATHFKPDAEGFVSFTPPKT